MNKKLFLGIGIIIVVVVVALVAISKNNNNSKVNLPTNEYVGTSTTEVDTPPTGTAAIQFVSSENTLTLAEVAKHNTEPDCYTAINGKVYDLTAWINKHPGGDRAILSICGKDGSAAFNGQHGGAPQQAQILAGFEVGVLAN